MVTKALNYLKKIETPKKSQVSLQFPQDLGVEGHDSSIRFYIFAPTGSKHLSGASKNAVTPVSGGPVTSNYRQPGSNSSSIARRFSDNVVNTGIVISLFMPPQIQSSYTTNWSSEELGMVGAGIDAWFGSDFRSWEGWEKSWEVIKNTLGQSALRTATSAIQALTPLNAESARRKVQGVINNPYMEVIFNGIENRRFSFTFKMIPRNAKEQETIKSIVDEFKFHRAPELKFEGQSNYWLFPSEFDIEFHNKYGQNPWLFKISTCALTNCTVNYVPTGEYATFEDGSPLATELTLEFTELEVLTKERLREGY